MVPGKDNASTFSGSDDQGSPFHEGELHIQERLGVRSQMDMPARRGIRSYMPDQHREFFSQLPFLIVGSLDREGQPWASMRVGHPGFVSSPDAQQLIVRSSPMRGDPVGDNLQVGDSIGLLGIQFHTRRRNRLNGVVSDITSSGLKLDVSQSFGNCPKYIQARSSFPEQCEANRHPEVICSESLDASMVEMISKADTFFIASSHPTPNGLKPMQGVDVSHRGGMRGFVKIDQSRRVLTVPDYTGNFFFNTLGNLLLNPRAGLLFLDFDTGDLLYLAVDVKIIWEGAELDTFEGAQRLLKMEVRKAVRAAESLPWKWSRPELSPYLSRLSKLS
ncbi:hypothetical protein BTA51_22175 [Hahella sp. CCB-MM4]|nr:hypothetical protein BTA51_22175 [Hahella sp. CCB-MM4]